MNIQDRINNARKKIEDGRKQYEEAEHDLAVLRKTARKVFKTEAEFRQWLKRHQLPESEALLVWRSAQ